MAAYVIADVEIADPESYKAYSARVPESIARHGGRFLARGGAVEHLEGDWQPQRLVVIEFPDLAAVRAWYDSEEYRELVPIRQGASRRGALAAVEGV